MVRCELQIGRLPNCECNRDSSDTIKRIWKQSVLKDFRHSQYIKLENGYSADVYSLDVIVAIAWQVDTYQALLFRRWLMRKIENRKESHTTPEKLERTMIIVMNGTIPRGIS